MIFIFYFYPTSDLTDIDDDVSDKRPGDSENNNDTVDFQTDSKASSALLGKNSFSFTILFSGNLESQRN